MKNSPVYSSKDRYFTVTVKSKKVSWSPERRVGQVSRFIQEDATREPVFNYMRTSAGARQVSFSEGSVS